MPAEVCIEPSGNLNPPLLDSIIPCTVSSELGVVVPMPTLPVLSSKMLESPTNELTSVELVHLGIRQTVPPPMTTSGTSGPCAGEAVLAADMRLNCAGFCGRVCASKSKSD